MAALRLVASRRTFSPLFRPEFIRVNQRNASTWTQRPLLSPRAGLYATIFAVTTGLFAVYYFDSRSALHRYVITPILRYTLDPETGHKTAVKVLSSGLGPRDTQADDERLRFELWGEQMVNPVGIAAGFDKDGEAIDGLFNLGFSWVEIGSVTPKPQPGNPRPRVFHLPSDRALINRYGFPSDGHAAVLSRIRARIPAFKAEDEVTPASLRQGTLLAVNLGKNKSSPQDSIDDFVAGVHAFAPYADVLVVNVSSPNTPGLRGLQSRDLLEKLLSGVTQARDEAAHAANAQSSSRKPKIVLKIAPDLTESEVVDIAVAIRNSAVDGVIVSNTTTRRPAHLTDPNKVEAGGLSGVPLKPYTLATLRALRPHLPASIPIIGCGGISSGEDALEYAREGATAVQLYTHFGYDGPGACRRIKDELADELTRARTTWAEVVQKATEELSWKEPQPEAEPTTPSESVGQLTKAEQAEGMKGRLMEQAEELKRLLDLGERTEASDAAEAKVDSSDVSTA